MNADVLTAARRHERLLWGICFRMTGVAADADELLQETWVRLLQKPPSGELKPWLTRVAVNLARDRLRQRKRTPYDGEWFPSPVEVGAEALELEEPAATERRYELLESVSLAFLLALEALSPKQRAVVILCDVVGLSGAEVADTLALTEGSVKVLHHRARAKLAGYESERPAFDAETLAHHRATLERFFGSLAANDSAALIEMLAEGVVGVADANGETHANRKTVYGIERLLLFYRRVMEISGPADRHTVRVLSGRPALIAEWDRPRPGLAPRAVLFLDLDREGKIAVVRSIQASRKLQAVARLG